MTVFSTLSSCTARYVLLDYKLPETFRRSTAMKVSSPCLDYVFDQSLKFVAANTRQQLLVRSPVACVLDPVVGGRVSRKIVAIR